MTALPDSHPDPPVCDGEAMLLAVYRAAERITAELDLTRALEEIIACVRNPLGLDRAGVFLYRNRRGDLIRLIGIDEAGQVEYAAQTPIPIHDGCGPMQQVALGRAPYFHSHDVGRDVPVQIQMPPGLRAHAIVPLVNRGEIIGVMAVDNLLTGRDIPEAMIRPLCLFAHFAALALGNALHAHDLGDLNRKLQRLAEMTGAFNGILRPDPLLRHMLQCLPDLLAADRYSAWRRGPDRRWQCVGVRGLSDDYPTVMAALYSRGEYRNGAMDRLFRRGEPVFLADLRSHGARHPYGVASEREGICSLLGIPLCHGAELLGCVNLYYDEPPDLSEPDREIARLFARHAGTALRNADLFEMRAALDDQLRRVNQELQEDRQLLITRQEELRHGEAQKKQFYRDVLYAVTNGKIVLSDREELDREWRHDLAGMPIEGPEDVKDCRHLVEEHARAAGMTDDRVHDLCVCASEATTNALKHAGGGWLRVSRANGTFRIRVSDQGAGIDTLQLPHATLMRGYSTRASMGLGFTLMHEMADRLLLSSGPEGTTLILEMALQPESEVDRALALLKAVEF